jgi:hypothetical protein
MKASACARLLVSLLLLWQLAAASAFEPSHTAVGNHAAASTAEHCAKHPATDSSAPTPSQHCCEQGPGCHCLQTLAPGLPDLGLAHVPRDSVQVVLLRAPPPSLQADEHFRPPI